jgi:hypothetical protein
MRLTLPTLVLCLAFCAAGCPKDNKTSGGGGAGMGGAGTGSEAPIDPTYANVSMILGGPEQAGIGSCAASSCHGGDVGKAGLNIKKVTNLTEALVNVPSCENSSMMRVKPGDPEHSWLWIKLTADVVDTTEGKLVYSGTPTTCTGVATGFGTRMPQVVGSFAKLSDAKLNAIKGWIMAGAPAQ